MYWLIAIGSVYLVSIIFLIREARNAPDFDEKTGKFIFRDKKKDK